MTKGMNIAKLRGRLNIGLSDTPAKDGTLMRGLRLNPKPLGSIVRCSDMHLTVLPEKGRSLFSLRAVDIPLNRTPNKKSPIARNISRTFKFLSDGIKGLGSAVPSPTSQTSVSSALASFGIIDGFKERAIDFASSVGGVDIIQNIGAFQTNGDRDGLTFGLIMGAVIIAGALLAGCIIKFGRGGTAKNQTTNIFKKAGLIAGRNKIKNGNISQYQNLFKLAKGQGGLLKLIRKSRLNFEDQKVVNERIPDHFRHIHPNAFLKARNRAAKEGKEDIKSLTALYREYIYQTILSLNHLSYFGETSIDSFNKTTNPIALLSVLFEALKDEDHGLINELHYHIDISQLLIIRDGLVRRLGKDPSNWDESITAHIRRDNGASLEVGGIVTWDGRKERPGLYLPKDLWTNPEMPWADHPLFKEINYDIPQSVGGVQNLGVGFVKVDTHDGSDLFWRYQRNPETNMPEVLITGTLSTLGEIAGRLAAANGGFNLDVAEVAFFPLNNAIEHIIMVSFHEFDKGFAQHIEFANATAVSFRFNEETMMYEIVFSRPEWHFVEGMNRPFVPLLRPGQVFPMWKKVIDAYTNDTDYEREFLFHTRPDVSSILGAMKDVARAVNPESAHFIGDNLDSSQALIRRHIPEQRGFWHAEAGVVFDRNGGVKRLVIHLFDRHLIGRWGEVQNLKRSSPVIALEGTTKIDGSGISWKQKLYGPAGRDANRIFQEYAEQRGLTNQRSLTVEPMPRPMDKLPSFVGLKLPSAQAPRLTDDRLDKLNMKPKEKPSYTDALSRVASHIGRFPITPDGLNRLMERGPNEMSAEELVSAIPDVRESADTIINWLSWLAERHPTPFLKDLFNRYMLEVKRVVFGLQDATRERRQLATIIRDILHYELVSRKEMITELKETQIHLKRLIANTEKKDPGNVTILEGFRTLLDIARLAGTGFHKPEILLSIDHEITQYFIYLDSQMGLVSADYQSHVNHIIQMHAGDEKFMKALRHYIKRSKEVGLHDSDWWFIRFLEIHVGLRFKQEGSVWQITDESRKWSTERYEMLFNVKKPNRVIGKKRAQIWKLIGEIIHILN